MINSGRFDTLSIVGFLVAFTALMGGNFLEGGRIDSLLQGTAFFIVVGGTVGAVMLQTPPSVFKRAMKMFSWVIKTPRFNHDEQIAKVIEWSEIHRRDGPLALERLARREVDLFTRKGIMLIVEGYRPGEIRSILEVEISAYQHKEMQAAKVFEGMGGYSPTLGIIGAVMGLIHVMNNLTEPDKLGDGIATAFVATVYGVAFANLVFLPVANKLKSTIQMIVLQQAMALEGVVGIAEGTNVRVLENKLRSFFNEAG